METRGEYALAQLQDAYVRGRISLADFEAEVETVLVKGDRYGEQAISLVIASLPWPRETVRE